MSIDNQRDQLARRSFLSRVSAGAAAVAAAFGTVPEALAAPAPSAAPAAAAGDWQPARHQEDDWYDPPAAARHRFFIDTTEPEGFGQGLAWTRNFLEASASGYGLKDADAAVIVCARHRSTAFAFNDAMWAKYGAELAERSNNTVDPKTKQVPTVNIYLASGYGETLRNNNTSLDALIKRGVRFAVCGMATRRIATLIAQKRSANVEDVLKELSAALIPNAHIVPAGIVAVNRAQERGYTVATVA